MNRLTKLVAGSLRQQPLGSHPGAETLAAFAENALGRPERQQTLAHLSECGDCREVLYLAQATPVAAQAAVVYRPKRITHFALRWGAVAASLVIVAGGLFITRHEFFLAKQEAPHQPTPAYYDKLAEKKAAPEFDSVRNTEAAAATEEFSAASSKARPAEKHMTAKPKADMRFDESGQVQVLSQNQVPSQASGLSHPSLADSNGIVEVGKKSKPRDDRASANVPSAAPAPNAVSGNVAEDRLDSKDAPHATNETVGVSAGAPAVETESETTDAIGSAKLEASRQTHGDARVLKQNGALFKTQGLPVAQWQLSTQGGVRRSFDAGKTWQNVSVAGTDARFRAVFSSGDQVWVGGTAGVLFHSSDSGLTWEQVIPVAAGQKLQTDISHIEFSDPQTGAVITANGETWMTSDAGQTWRRK